jgi:hypothetical protein
MSEQIETPSDLEAVARALCQYDADCQEMPADEMWALYSSEYMNEAESSMAVLAPLLASKREAGYQAGYIDGMAKGKADAQRDDAESKKHQEFIDLLPADCDDKMFEQIDHWARLSFRQWNSGARGQMTMRGDGYESHIIWASLRWAKENCSGKNEVLQ